MPDLSDLIAHRLPELCPLFGLPKIMLLGMNVPKTIDKGAAVAITFNSPSPPSFRNRSSGSCPAGSTARRADLPGWSCGSRRSSARACAR